MILSLHMEKCGGTSLKAFLLRQYGSKLAHYSSGIEVVDESKLQSKPKHPFVAAPANKSVSDLNLEMLHGHFSYGLHEKYGLKPRYITMLRHPIDRFLSHFYHVKQRSIHPLHEQVKDMELRKFVHSFAPAKHLQNFMVHRYAGTADNQWIPKTSADLNKAWHNLKDFEIVGFLSRRSEFLAAGVEKLGWDADCGFPNENTTQRRQHYKDLTKDDRKVVEYACALDIELYSRARNHFGV